MDLLIERSSNASRECSSATDYDTHTSSVHSVLHDMVIEAVAHFHTAIAGTVVTDRLCRTTPSALSTALPSSPSILLSVSPLEVCTNLLLCASQKLISFRLAVCLCSNICLISLTREVNFRKKLIDAASASPARQCSDVEVEVEVEVGGLHSAEHASDAGCATGDSHSVAFESSYRPDFFAQLDAGVRTRAR